MGGGIFPGKEWDYSCYTPDVSYTWELRHAPPYYEVLTAETDELQWAAFTAGDPLPAGAVAAGTDPDGVTLYSIRAVIAGDYHCGLYNPEMGQGKISFGGYMVLDIPSDIPSGEILTGISFCFILCRNINIPR